MEELDQFKNVPVKIAAQLLGVSQEYVRCGLINNRLPIGSATKINGSKWTYHISPGLLKEYITGKSLKDYFNENKEILKAILTD